MKKQIYEILLWIVYLIGPCKAPAVSLSFGSKAKTNSAMPSVFAFRNGSWVLLNDSTVHFAKNGPAEGKENLYKELVDELLRKLNLATVQKRTAATMIDLLKPAPTKPTLPDKSIADLFFEWLNKQEDLNRTANKHSSFTTALPVLGLQIDLDDWSKGVTSKSKSNSHKKLSIHLPRRSVPFNRQRKKRFTPIKNLRKRRSAVGGGQLKPAVSRHPSRITKIRRAVTEPSADAEGTVDRPAVIVQTDPDDRKTKLNGLPKYVMRFLSQCKELIEQNYDDRQTSADALEAKDSNHNSVSPVCRSYNMVAASHGQDSRTQTESSDRFVTSLAIVVNNDDDYLQPNRKLELSKEAMNVEHVRNQMADAIKAQVNGLDSIKIKIPHSGDEVDYAGEKRYDDSSSSEWREGDYYDHLEASKNLSKIAKVTKPKYYESEDNCSSCKPILDQFTPEREVFTEECPQSGARSGDQTTLSPLQWKALMDFLNERVGGDCSSTCPTTPCPTFPPRPRKTTAAKCPPTTTTGTTTTCTTRTTTRKTTKCPTTKCPTRPTCRFTNPPTTECTTTCPTTTTCTTTTTCPTTTTCKTTTTSPTTTTPCPTTTTTTPTTTTTCPTTTTTCPTTTTTCPTTKKSCPSTTCAPLSLDYLMDLGAASSDKDGETGLPKSKPDKALTDNKPPLRYSIMFDHLASDQQHLQQLSNIKPKNTNWFDNIRSLKLLEGLRSPPTPNTMRAVYFDMKPYKGPQPQTNVLDAKNEDHGEKMIAEGVIPLKTGSTLNLYISYVLNRTKEHKNNDIFSDNSQGKMVKKTI